MKTLIRLETNEKYYAIELTTDLLGDHVIVCHFGSKLTKHGHTKTIVVTDFLDACRKIRGIVKTRLRHGYRAVK